MRLTLRNLLRFLDETWTSTQERQRLEELVRQSGRAEAWMDRIRRLRSDTARKLPSPGGDPAASRVARYLDGAMSEQETADFEEALLASDDILAEVAGVHRLVKQVHQAPPATIPTVLRQTLYDVDRLYASTAGVREAGGNGEESVDIPASMTDLPFDDDWTRDADEPKPAVLPGERRHERGEAATSTPVSLDQLQRRATGRSVLVGVLMAFVLGSSFAVTYWVGWMVASSGRVAAIEPENRGEQPDPANDNDKDKGEEPVVPGDGDKDIADAGDDAPVIDVDDDLPVDPPADAGVDDANEGDEAVVDAIPRRPDLSFTISEVTVVVEPEFLGPPFPPRLVARIALGNPLARIQTVSGGEWLTMLDPANLHEGDRLQVLTGGTVEFAMGDLLKCSLAGPALLTIGERDLALGADVLVLDHGELAVECSANDVDWILQAGDDRFRMEVMLQDTRIAVATRGWLPPGADPQSVRPVSARLIHSERGQCLVHLNDSQWTLSAGQALVQARSPLPEHELPATTGAIDERHEPPRYVQRITAVAGSELRSWTADRTDVSAQLADLKTDLRQEVRLAAMTWLAEQGNFDFVVDYLQNADNGGNWRTFVQAVRHTILNRPEFAANLRDGLGYAGLDKQALLYELMLGKSPADLEAGADARLVELLSDGDLAVRALAIENLREITDGVTYGYLPTRPESDRRRIIERQWQPRLEKKNIRYEQPPAVPLPTFTGASPAGTDEPAADGEIGTQQPAASPPDDSPAGDGGRRSP